MIGARIHGRATEAALFVESEKLSTLAGTTPDDRAADQGESSAMLQDFAAALQELIAPNQKDDSSESSSKELIYATGSVTKSKSGKTNDQATSISQAKLLVSAGDPLVPQFRDPDNSDQPLANDRQPDFFIYRNEHAANSFASSTQSESSENKSAGIAQVANSSHSLTSFSNLGKLQTLRLGALVDPHTTSLPAPLWELRPSTIHRNDRVPASKLPMPTNVDGNADASAAVSKNEFVKNQPSAKFVGEPKLRATPSLATINLAHESTQVGHQAISSRLVSTSHQVATSKQSDPELNAAMTLNSDSTALRSASPTDNSRSPKPIGLFDRNVSSIANVTTTPPREEPKSTHRTISRADFTTVSDTVSTNVSNTDQRSMVTVQNSFNAVESQNSTANPPILAKPTREFGSFESLRRSLRTSNTIKAHSSAPASSPTQSNTSRSAAKAEPESVRAEPITIDTQATPGVPVQQSLPESHESTPHIASMTKPRTSSASDGADFVHSENAVDKTSKISGNREAKFNRAEATTSPETPQTMIDKTRSPAIAREQVKVAANAPNLLKDATATEFERPTEDAKRSRGVTARISKTAGSYELSTNDELPKGSTQAAPPDARATSGGLAPTVSFGARHSSPEPQTDLGTFGRLEVTQIPSDVNDATPHSFENHSDLTVAVHLKPITQPTINRPNTNPTKDTPIGTDDSSAWHLGTAPNMERAEAQPASDVVSTSAAVPRHDPIETDLSKSVASRTAMGGNAISTSRRIPQHGRDSFPVPDGASTTAVPTTQSSELVTEEPTNGSFVPQSPLNPTFRQGNGQIPQNTHLRIATPKVVESLQAERPANVTHREPPNTVDDIVQRSQRGEPTASDTDAGMPDAETLHMEKDDNINQLSASPTKVSKTATNEESAPPAEYSTRINFAEALPLERNTNSTNGSFSSNMQSNRAVADANLQLELPEIAKGATQKRLSEGQSTPTAAISRLSGAGNVPASSTQTAEAESIRMAQDATQLITPARIANLSIENAEGQTIHATVRERTGTIDVKIVTPSSGSAQRIGGEIDTMRQNLDAAGLRLGHSEVSYQDGGRQRRGEENQQLFKSGQSRDKQETFTFSEVVE